MLIFLLDLGFSRSNWFLWSNIWLGAHLWWMWGSHICHRCSGMGYAPSTVSMVYTLKHYRMTIGKHWFGCIRQWLGPTRSTKISNLRYLFIKWMVCRTTVSWRHRGIFMGEQPTTSLTQGWREFTSASTSPPSMTTPSLRHSAESYRNSYHSYPRSKTYSTYSYRWVIPLPLSLSLPPFPSLNINDKGVPYRILALRRHFYLMLWVRFTLLLTVLLLTCNLMSCVAIW